ncbi:hypothetical protein [Comamonas sp. F1-6]|uniref:hypothetical protein n=1 Tax=Comamonas sp. F1-6 TaxID=673550 RepID=UPI0031DCA3E1
MQIAAHFNNHWEPFVINVLTFIRPLRNSLCALGAAFALLGGSAVHAQSEASLVLSVLPVASVVAAASGGASEEVVAIPLFLSAAGASVIVEAVESSATGVTYVLKNVADGTSAVVKVSGQAAGALSVGVGTVVQTSATAAGVILSTAGKVLAFIPNEIGKALMHNERL